MRWLAILPLLTLLGCAGVQLPGQVEGETVAEWTCETKLSDYLNIACGLVFGGAEITVEYAVCVRGKRAFHETKMAACILDGVVEPSI